MVLGDLLTSSQEIVMNSFVTNVERDVYLKHIRRLEEDNRLLAAVVADERRLRIAAWQVSWRWCQNTIWGLLRAMMIRVEGERRSYRSFVQETEHTAA